MRKTSTIYICPHCNKQCTVTEELIGGDVNCPHCGNIFNATPAEIANPPVAGASDVVDINRLEGLVASSIRETLKIVVVQRVQLSHISDVKYKGLVTMMTAQGVENHSVDVSFDGNNIAWQLSEEGQQQKGRMGFRILGLVGLLFCGWMCKCQSSLLTQRQDLLSL